MVTMSPGRGWNFVVVSGTVAMRLTSVTSVSPTVVSAYDEVLRRGGPGLSGRHPRVDRADGGQGPSHAGGRGVRMRAELLRDGRGAARDALPAQRRGDRLPDVVRRRPLGGLQPRDEQRLGPDHLERGGHRQLPEPMNRSVLLSTRRPAADVP